MSAGVLLDTDVMVDYLRGHPRAVAFVTGQTEPIAVSAIVVAELNAGVKGAQEQAMLDELISAVRVVPVTERIAPQAGQFKRDFGKAHGLGLADAVIAATAPLEQLPYAR